MRCFISGLVIAMFVGFWFVEHGSAATITDVGFAAVDGDAGATQLLFHQYVSNPQPGESTVGSGTVETFSSPFDGFVNPSSDNTTQNPLPPSVNVSVESSTGTVEFFDGTGSQVVSDILHPGLGQTLSFRFGTVSSPFAVSGFGLRFGSVGGAVTASFFDVDNNLLGIDTIGTGISVAEGWEALDGGSPVSVIHRVEINTTSSDVFLIGSFTSSPSTATDLAFNGLAFVGTIPIPEPSTSVLLGAGLIGLINLRTKRRKSLPVKV